MGKEQEQNVKGTSGATDAQVGMVQIAPLYGDVVVGFQFCTAPQTFSSSRLEGSGNWVTCEAQTGLQTEAE